MIHAHLFTLLCVGLFCSLTSGKSLSPVTKDDRFDYLLFAQFWPWSSCIYFEEKGDSCSIPPNVHGWTIHGLWPSRPNSEEPQDCNASMPFDYSQIASLRNQLELNWPYLKKDDDKTYLWSHEWVKHGTCAYSLPATRGELKYFSRTLQLHGTVNLTRALEDGGIVPSKSKTYRVKEIESALQNKYNVQTVLVCDYDSKTQKTYLDQVYLCYDKSFNLMDCPAQSSPKDGSCRSDDDIRYIPYNQGRQANRKSLIFKSENSG